MAHQGIPDYTGDTGGNVSIVGGGFTIIKEASGIGGPTNTEAVFFKTGLGPHLLEDYSFDDASYWDIPDGATVNLGEELAVNGDFSDDDTGWTAENNADLSTVAGGESGDCLKVKRILGYPSTSQIFTTVIGKSYIISFYYKDIDNIEEDASWLLSSALNVYYGGANNVFLPADDSQWKKEEFTFVAVSTTTTIRLRNNGQIGESFYFDTVSLKETGTGKAIYTNVGNGKTLDGDYDVDAVPDLTYRVSFTIDSITEGGLFPRIGLADGTIRTTAGTYTEDIKAIDSNVIMLKTSGETSATIDNFSCQIVSGPYCVAIKNISTGNVYIQAQSVVGDDLTKGASYDKEEYDDYISLSYGDIVFGIFDKVAIEEPSSALLSPCLQLIKGGE